MNTLIRFGLSLMFLFLLIMLISLTPSPEGPYYLKIDEEIENLEGLEKDLMLKFCYHFFKEIEGSNTIKLVKDSLNIIERLQIYESKDKIPSIFANDPKKKHNCIFIVKITKTKITKTKDDSLLLMIKIKPDKESRENIYNYCGKITKNSDKWNNDDFKRRIKEMLNKE